MLPLVVDAREVDLPRAEPVVAHLAVRVGHAVDPGLGAVERGRPHVEPGDLCRLQGHDAPAGDGRVVAAGARRVAPGEVGVLRRLEERDRLLGRGSVSDGVRDPVRLGEGEGGDRVVVHHLAYVGTDRAVRVLVIREPLEAVPHDVAVPHGLSGHGVHAGRAVLGRPAGSEEGEESEAGHSRVELVEADAVVGALAVGPEARAVPVPVGRLVARKPGETDGDGGLGGRRAAAVLHAAVLVVAVPAAVAAGAARASAHAHGVVDARSRPGLPALHAAVGAREVGERLERVALHLAVILAVVGRVVRALLGVREEDLGLVGRVLLVGGDARPLHDAARALAEVYLRDLGAVELDDDGRALVHGLVAEEDDERKTGEDHPVEGERDHPPGRGLDRRVEEEGGRVVGAHELLPLGGLRLPRGSGLLRPPRVLLLPSVVSLRHEHCPLARPRNPRRSARVPGKRGRRS